MKLKTLKRMCIMFCVNRILAGVRFFPLKRRLLRAAGYEIGEGTSIVGPLRCDRSLKIGSNCWIGRDFAVHGCGSVEIGDNCDIAPGVSFLTGGHRIGPAARRAGEGERYAISVGSGTWIGGNVTVTGDTRIGTGCVVAACACVVSDIPDNTLVGGVPAKVIRELNNEL